MDDNKKYTIISTIAISIIVLSIVTIINKRWIGQRLQSIFGINPFLDYDMTINDTEVKNNNPLNIRHSNANKWQGEITTAQTKDGEFSKFDTLEHGIRAAIVNMHTYIIKYEPDNIRSIINRWAPPSDNNDVVAYEKVVMAQMNKIYPSLKSTTTLTSDYKMLTLIAWAMSAMELGYKHQPSQQTFVDVQKKYFP